MPDMLVRLYKLPPMEPVLEKMKSQGVEIRRAQAHEISMVRKYAEEHFSVFWADEVSVAFARQPISLYVATIGRKMVGFGAYECTRRDYFGPTGVTPEHRGKGIGLALLLACMWGLQEMGYAYGIIGGAGPVEFYRKAVGAEVIEDSVPGIYVPHIQET